MQKMVNGKQVTLSAEEEAKVLASWQASDDAAVQYETEDSWKDKRKEMYLPIEDYVDMIWHALDAELPLDKTSDFYKTRKTVKDTYPKPI